MLYLELFWEFFKAGLFAVGGGMATVPFLVDISTRKGWYSIAQLTDMIAVSESTPGPIGVNMATYVGFTTSGIIGALISTFALILPSLVIITIIASFLSKFNERKAVKAVFYILKAVSLGMISYAIYSIARLSFTNFYGIVFSVLCLTGIFVFKKMHPLVFIALGAIFGILFL